MMIILCSVAFISFIVVLVAGAYLPVSVLIFYSAVSTITFILYGWDKFAARKNIRRIRENMLHSWDLVGGWPGGLLAQRVFRHKTHKASFRRAFWLTVMLNTLLLATLLTPLGQQWLTDWAPFLEDFVKAVVQLD